MMNISCDFLQLGSRFIDNQILLTYSQASELVRTHGGSGFGMELAFLFSFHHSIIRRYPTLMLSTLVHI
jgi:hypothetical protein